MLEQLSIDDRVRRLRLLVIGQKVLEGGAAMLVGAYASSVALVAVARVSDLDEVRLLAWRDPKRDRFDDDPQTSRFLGFGAQALGSYVFLRWAYAILASAHPSPHFDAGAALKSASMGLLLAVSVLAGLVLNTAFGVWKADPMSALPIAGFLFCSRRTFAERLESGDRARSAAPTSGEMLVSNVAHVGRETARRMRRLFRGSQFSNPTQWRWAW